MKRIAFATLLTLLFTFWCCAEETSLEIYGSTSPSGESGGIGVLLGHNPVTLLYVGDPSFMGFRISGEKTFEGINTTAEYRLLGFAGTYRGKAFYRFQAGLEATKERTPIGIGILAKSGNSFLDVIATAPTEYMSIVGLYGISSAEPFGQAMKASLGMIYSPNAGTFGPYLALNLQNITSVDFKCLGVFTPNVTYHVLLRVNVPYVGFIFLEISENLLAVSADFESIKIKVFRLGRGIGTAFEVPIRGR